MEKVDNLDVKDRKLLYYLSQDARYSDTQLAGKVGLSKNSIKYRVERLHKVGIIEKFTATINLGSLGFNTYTILLRFNENIYENMPIIDYFKNHEFISWVVSLSGQWDLFIEIIAKDSNHLSEIIEKMLNHFQDNLNTYKIFSSKDTLRVEHLIEDVYNDLKLQPLEIKERVNSVYKIDKIDKKILNLLVENSSLSFVEIATQLKTTTDVIRYRIKNLIDKGIIIKFFPEIDLKKLGYTDYIYTIKLKDISLKKFNELKKEVSNDTHLKYAFVDINSLQLILNCAFKTTEDVDIFTRNIRSKYHDIIENQEYLIVKEQILFNLFPKGLL